MSWFGKWITIRDTGVHRYQQHSRTGKRRILYVCSTGYQPRDDQWVETGRWSSPDRATRIEVGDSTILTTHTGATGAGTGC
jgi:hypothetical protein